MYLLNKGFPCWSNKIEMEKKKSRKIVIIDQYRYDYLMFIELVSYEIYFSLWDS